jgi:hypothetical protein
MRVEQQEWRVERLFAGYGGEQEKGETRSLKTEGCGTLI